MTTAVEVATVGQPAVVVTGVMIIDSAGMSVITNADTRIAVTTAAVTIEPTTEVATETSVDMRTVLAIPANLTAAMSAETVMIITGVSDTPVATSVIVMDSEVAQQDMSASDMTVKAIAVLHPATEMRLLEVLDTPILLPDLKPARHTEVRSKEYLLRNLLFLTPFRI